MSPFRRNRERTGTLLPAASLQALATYGLNHFNGIDPDTAATVEMFFTPGMEAANKAPERLVSEICEAASDSGGWALVGGVRLLMELDLVRRCSADPQFLALLDGALRFMQSQGAPSGALRPFESDRWIETQGSLRTFIGYDLAEMPPPGDEPALTDLQVGDFWKVVQLGAQPNSNMIYVERREADLYFAVTQAPRSDEDPERVMWDWFSEGTLLELLRELGERMVTPPYWAHEDLLPYFPWQPPQEPT